MNDLKIERMKKEPKYIAFSTQKGEPVKQR